ncbi:hypothetical protein [Pseudomonas mosselii]|uniref:hypothetical protein n=1 Tax=Pseudomonas mosselii TaxID=78327 RepID=UPI001F19A5DA|nr:hypothetical protein [Pseudomonas mosselii]
MTSAVTRVFSPVPASKSPAQIALAGLLRFWASGLHDYLASKPRNNGLDRHSLVTLGLLPKTLMIRIFVITLQTAP